MRSIEVGTLNITDKAKQYVMEVLNNNRLSYGPFLMRLEHEFANIHQCNYAIVSNSGTSALHVALQTLKELHGWNDGDEVIVPAVTFIATSNIVIHNRMTPVFIDVEKEYYGIDPELIEAKITPRTRAIIPVHLFGMPCEMDSIMALAKKYNLKVIEDSCEAMFASYKGKRVGSFGDIGCFSLYVAHLLTAGVGGINTTNNREYAIALRSLINHGRDSIYFALEDDDGKSLDELREIIARRFRFVRVGHSFRVTEMEGALAVEQLEHWPEMIKKRRENGAYLCEQLARFEKHIQLPKLRPHAEHSFMMFPIVLKCEKKDRVVNDLEQHGIETREMLPLTNQPIYKKLFNLNEEEYLVAQWINDGGFYIGCHQGLTKDDLDYIVKIFAEIFG